MDWFETVLEIKGFPLQEARRQLLQFDSHSTEKRVYQIRKNKWTIARYHANRNQLYKKLLGGGLPERWSDLPIIRKTDFQQPLAEMLSNGFTERNVYVSNTSGSSGHPFFFAKDKMSHALTWAFIMSRYASLGITGQSIQARFYGIPLDGFSFIKESIKDWMMNRVRFPVFDLGDAKLGEFLDLFERRRVDYVYGYTNSILLFSRYLLRQGVMLKDISPALSICIVTSEVCIDEDKSTIERALGVPVIREYGASELDIIAIEDTNGRWAVNQSNLLVEVVDQNDEILPHGEEGRLVITSLHNKAMPFIRYDVGDIGVLEETDEGLCLRKLLGRTNDTVVLPSGKRSAGLTFYYISRSILESSGVLKEFIIRQTSLDSFHFDIVSDRPLKESEVNEIRQKMTQYLEPGLKLTINRVDKIKRQGSGKIQHFYSELES